MIRLAASIACFLLALGGIELTLRYELFHYASYSNSQSIDDQLRRRNASSQWRILFVGDSETKWGVHPLEIDSAFLQSGIHTKSFNHAFDGFGASWWPLLLPHIIEHPSLSQVNIVALGIQLIDMHQGIEFHTAPCGALQKPVLTSPFSIDMGLATLCRSDTWDTALGRRLFSWLWTVRYSSAIRGLLIPSMVMPTEILRYNSRKSGDQVNGFEPHHSISHDRSSYTEEFRRWKSQYGPDRDLRPLPSGLWETLAKPKGFFDQVLKVVRDSGRQLVLFSVPTNPVVIDTFNRRRDYTLNSITLSRWALNRGVPFYDPGIHDVEDPESFFSDMRHLSEEGARMFSRSLGNWLAESLSSNVVESLPPAY